MKKRATKTTKKKNLWFKPLLSGLLILLMLLVWVGSRKSMAPDMLDSMPIEQSRTSEDSIGQVIAPLVDDNTYVLTFEDALPDPIFKEEHTDIIAADVMATDSMATDVMTTDGMEQRHLLGLIIDDVGYDLHALERLLALPYTLTVSILPDAPHAEEAARMAHQHGIKVMLHMPMQTSNPKYQQKMEKFYLHQDMDKQTFTAVFEAALAKVPYVEGINNHMGSQLTSDAKSMRWLMQLCKKHGLFFIDSRTAASSVGALSAQQAGIPWNERDVFLDHSVEPEELQKSWDSILSCVQHNDHCIMLAHPHKETLNFLEHHTSDFNPQKFVPIRQLLK